LFDPIFLSVLVEHRRVTDTDRHRHRHRRTQGYSIYRASIASRGKNNFIMSFIIIFSTLSLPIVQLSSIVEFVRQQALPLLAASVPFCCNFTTPRCTLDHSMLHTVSRTNNGTINVRPFVPFIHSFSCCPSACSRRRCFLHTAHDRTGASAAGLLGHVICCSGRWARSSSC